MNGSAGSPWWREISGTQWKTLVAAQVGWMLDAMDVMLYAFALTSIQKEFGFDSATAGAVAATTLFAAAIGGTAFGFLSDRFGRARMLTASILVYSIFTAATATSQTLVQLVAWRLLVGIGMGGEWTAGSVLVAETWPAAHRGKAIGFMQSGWAIGTMLAAVLAAAILPTGGWRWLFAAGVLPAFMTAWIRRSVPEPEVWRRSRDGTLPAASRATLRTIFRPPMLRRTVAATAMATALLCAYWGLFTWIPAFLASPHEKGGAGLGVVRSAGWIVAMQAGAFLGYTTFGLLSDRFGRRPVFFLFVLGAAVLVPIYGQLRSEVLLLVLGPLIGFFGHGYFSVFGSLLAEIFPSSIRGAAQGLCYNAGRAASAFAPILIGALADGFGFGSALAATALFYLTGAVAMAFLPETRGEALA
jgi:MFS family permease